MPRPSHLCLALAIVLYLAFRAWVLVANFDAVALPNYELTVMGNLAYVITTGWRGPPLAQYFDNCGGHLGTGILAVPLFLLLGPSYLVLKLVPVLLGLGCLLWIWAILARHADRRAASLAVLLYAIGPPTLAKYSMLAKGNHFENLFFQLGCLWIFGRLHTSERKTPWVLAFGAAAGFAIFFYFGSMAMVALLALTHLVIRGWKRGLRDFALALPPFVLGLLPLLWVQLSALGRPGSFLKAKFAAEGGRAEGNFLSRVGDFLVDILPRAGVYEELPRLPAPLDWLGPIPGRVAEGLWLGGFVAAWAILAALVWRGWRSLRRQSPASSEEERELQRFRVFRLLPFLLYLPFVMLVVGTATFEFKPYGPPVEVGQFRYLVPHFLWSTMMLGIAFAALWRSGLRWRRTAASALAAATLVCGAFTLPIAGEDAIEPNLGLAYDGFLLRYDNNVLLRDSRVDPETGRLTWDHPMVVREVESFRPEERHELWFGVGYHLAAGQTMARKNAKTPPGFDIDALCAPYPPAAHPDLARGAGSSLRVVSGYGKTERALVDGALARLAESDDPRAAWVVEGMAMNFEFPLARLTGTRLERTRRLGESVPEPLRRHYWRGQGLECGRLWIRAVRNDRRLVDEHVATLPPEARAPYWLGYGMALARDGTPGDFGEALAHVPAEQRAHCLRGLGAGMRHGLGPGAATPWLQRWSKRFGPEELAWIEEGLRWPTYPLPADG